MPELREWALGSAGRPQHAQPLKPRFSHRQHPYDSSSGGFASYSNLPIPKAVAHWSIHHPLRDGGRTTEHPEAVLLDYAKPPTALTIGLNCTGFRRLSQYNLARSNLRYHSDDFRPFPKCTHCLSANL